MANAVRDYFKYSTLTASEVSELIQIPKSKVLSMVEENIIEPFKDYPEGAMFLKFDIDEIVKNEALNLPIHRMRKRTVMFDKSGTTDRSVQYFKQNIKDLDKVESIFIYLNDVDAIKAGFYKIDKDDEDDEECFKGLLPIDAPNFIIRDVKGNEMWLCGCNCGYGGRGPRGSKEILKELGFSENILDLVPYYKVINIFINEDNSVETVYHNGIESIIKKSTRIVNDDIDVILKHSKLNNNITLVQEKSRFYKVKPIEILEKFRGFIPSPKSIILMPKEIAKDKGYMISMDSNTYFPFYNLVIVDSSGVELWLNVLYKEDVHISKQDDICDILQYCGFNIPEDKMVDKIIGLVNTTVRKVEPESIIFEK